VKKESVNMLDAVVESDPKSEYSCSSVPTIKLATRIQNVEFPSVENAMVTDGIFDGWVLSAS